MPSLDFIYDITEKLDEEKLDYLVLAIREGRKEDKVDVFFRVGKEYYSLLKTFLVYLNRMPEEINENLYSSDIDMDKNVIEILRNIK